MTSTQVKFMSFAKFLRTPILQNICEWLLLWAKPFIWIMNVHVWMQYIILSCGCESYPGSTDLSRGLPIPILFRLQFTVLFCAYWVPKCCSLCNIFPYLLWAYCIWNATVLVCNNIYTKYNTCFFSLVSRK